MATVKDENYFVVHGWMRTKLELKGNELLVYAVLYGFSQDGESEFRGTVQYVADLVGSHRDTVVKTLEKLESRGLVKKVNYNTNKGQTNGFICVPIQEVGGVVKYDTPLREIRQGVSKNTIPGVVKYDTYKEIYKEDNKELYKVSKKVSNLKEKELTNNTHVCESYDDLLDGFGVFREYRQAVFRFISYLKVNFNLVMMNDRLENLIVKLDMCYLDDIDKVKALDDAIVKGYKRLECECA